MMSVSLRAIAHLNLIPVLALLTFPDIIMIKRKKNARSLFGAVVQEWFLLKPSRLAKMVVGVNRIV